jgi:hypothetical protein
MFDKFLVIREASARHFREAGSSPLGLTINDITAEEIEKDAELESEVARLIERLSRADLVELTGAVFFGRDSDDWRADPYGSLAEYTREYAYMAAESDHSRHLSQKPIHDYLQAAEGKLTRS